MAEPNKFWQFVHRLGESFNRDDGMQSALDELSKMPPEVQERSLKLLAQVAVASTALTAQATSRLALSKSS